MVRWSASVFNEDCADVHELPDEEIPMTSLDRDPTAELRSDPM